MGYIPATEENNNNGFPNRETWAFDLWISNDEGLHKIARHFVGDTAVNGSEVLNLICGIEQMALMETPKDDEDWTSSNSAYNMAIDMSTTTTANLKGFKDVNESTIATRLNEMFEPKE